MKIINYSNYIKIGDRYYPPNSYIVSTVNDDLVVITTLDNNINVTLAWTQFTDVNDDPYATLEDVITALLANNAFPPVVPADVITGSLTADKMPKASGANTLTNSQLRDNGVTVWMGIGPTSEKAIFDLISTTKGFFTPRMNTTQQGNIGAGATDTGLLLFNLTLGRFTFYNHADATFKKLLIPEDVGNKTIDSTVIPASHTGNTDETIVNYLTIPASSYTNGDFLDFMSLASIDTDANENKFYINTAPSLNGNQQQLLLYTQGGSVNIKLFADFLIYNNTLIGWKPPTTNSAVSYGNVVGVAPAISVNFTVTQYLLYTTKLTSAAKTFILKGMEINRRRKVA